MNNNEIYEIAMRQSACDSNCEYTDFLSLKNKVIISATNISARKYLKLPFYCDLTSYGNNIVASVNEEVLIDVQEYIAKYPTEHCFETPNMQILNDILKKHGMCICFMAEYFLPDMQIIKPLDCVYETRVLYSNNFDKLYISQWSNALNEERRSLDMIAVGAYCNGELIALAGASADCDTMWQIGVDVLPSFRKQGVAAAVTSKLACEILKKGIVPFYCCAWSNIGSVRNAIKSGFKPAWVQLTAKSMEFVADVNK